MVTSFAHSQFVRGVFAQSKADVALFTDTGDRSGAGNLLDVFFLSLMRLALVFVVQLAVSRSENKATVERHIKWNALRRPF